MAELILKPSAVAKRTNSGLGSGLACVYAERTPGD